MDLILAEQLLLIALDDAKGRDTTDWGSDAGLAAALLLDLARLGLVEVDADGAYSAIRDSSRRRDAKGWVGRLPRELTPLRERIARGLVARGVLSEEHTTRLGILPTTRFPERDPEPERRLRERLHEVLVDGRDPAEEEALLIGLLEPLGLVDSLVPRDRRRAARRRAKAVAEEGVAGSAVRDSVQAVQAAVIAVTVTTTTS
jgi:hypothetical protein